MTGCKRGDAVLVWFPNSDRQTFKKRPALVVEADDLNTGLPQVLVAMISSNLSRSGHPSRVFVARNSLTGSAGGLLTDSVILTDNLATVHTQALAQTLGRLPDLSAIDSALRHTLGL